MARFSWAQYKETKKKDKKNSTNNYAYLTVELIPGLYI